MLLACYLRRFSIAQLGIDRVDKFIVEESIALLTLYLPKVILLRLYIILLELRLALGLLALQLLSAFTIVIAFSNTIIDNIVGMLKLLLLLLLLITYSKLRGV